MWQCSRLLAWYCKQERHPRQRRPAGIMQQYYFNLLPTAHQSPVLATSRSQPRPPRPATGRPRPGRSAAPPRLRFNPRPPPATRLMCTWRAVTATPQTPLQPDLPATTRQPMPGMYLPPCPCQGITPPLCTPPSTTRYTSLVAAIIQATRRLPTVSTTW